MNDILAFLANESVVFNAAIISAAVQFVIAAFHLYWAWGGKWLVRVVVPQQSGQPVFGMSPIGSFIVFFILTVTGLVTLGRVGLYGLPEPLILYNSVPWILVVLFSLRAMGDFNWLGLFKKQKYTEFAFWDNVVYTPLSILLVLLNLVVALSPALEHPAIY